MVVPSLLRWKLKSEYGAVLRLQYRLYLLLSVLGCKDHGLTTVFLLPVG